LSASIEKSKVIALIKDFEERIKILKNYLDTVNKSDENARSALVVYDMVVKQMRHDLLGEKV
jgi:hypothetical protein